MDAGQLRATGSCKPTSPRLRPPWQASTPSIMLPGWRTSSRVAKQNGRRYQVNREGTRRLLEAIDRGGEPPETFLLISTVAVYGVNEGVLLDEGTERPAAKVPYGESKRQAEDMLLEWASRRGVRSTVIRLPLVVGAGAPGNLRSMVEAIRRGRYRDIGGGRARRSMVMADDAAAILPRAAAAGGIFHLTDGVHPAFVDLSAALAGTLRRGRVGNLPLWTARIAASAGDVVGRVTGRVMPINSRVWPSSLRR